MKIFPMFLARVGSVCLGLTMLFDIWMIFPTGPLSFLWLIRMLALGSMHTWTILFLHFAKMLWLKTVWYYLFVHRMQTASILSMKDLVVSHTELEGCDLALVKTSQGLYLKWQPHGDEGKEGAFLTDGKVGLWFYFLV